MQTNRRTASGALRALLTLSATTALLAATSHFAAPHAHADFIYGLNASGSKGIYRINTATGGVTLVASTPSLTASGAGGNGLNFGTGAFNGDQRWVQVEFRNPAGTGQYLTLVPRDKILAAPYALYALNSTASQWDYNPKTQALTSAQNVAKVGIGTNAPTAALEVVATGGDDAVKLPAGSIGPTELGGQKSASATFVVGFGPGQPISIVKNFLTDGPCTLLLLGPGGGGQGPVTLTLLVDGVMIAEHTVGPLSVNPFDVMALRSLGAGQHTLEARVSSSSTSSYWGIGANLAVIVLNEQLELR